jgi:flagellar basal body-associated protein FliL
MTDPNSKTPRSKPVLYLFMAIALITLALGIVAAFRVTKSKTSDDKAPEKRSR